MIQLNKLWVTVHNSLHLFYTWSETNNTVASVLAKTKIADAKFVCVCVLQPGSPVQNCRLCLRGSPMCTTWPLEVHRLWRSPVRQLAKRLWKPSWNGLTARTRRSQPHRESKQTSSSSVSSGFIFVTPRPKEMYRFITCCAKLVFSSPAHTVAGCWTSCLHSLSNDKGGGGLLSFVLKMYTQYKSMH